VLGTPPALILSQDQTLMLNCRAPPRRDHTEASSRSLRRRRIATAPQLIEREADRLCVVSIRLV
jgi:hypothetical protein